MADRTEFTCKKLVELVTAYLDGALSTIEHAGVERHLDGCEECRIFLDQMRLTIALIGRFCTEDVPPETLQELLVSLRARISAAP